MMIGYSTIICCNSSCGISFAVPDRWQQEKRNDHSRFFCPNGHGQFYNCESEEEKIRRERDRLKQMIAQKDDEIKEEKEKRKHHEQRVITYKGHLTRTKKRHAAGVCPCCNRTFSALSRHMQTKHPDYKVSVAA